MGGARINKCTPADQIEIVIEKLFKAVDKALPDVQREFFIEKVLSHELFDKQEALFEPTKTQNPVENFLEWREQRQFVGKSNPRFSRSSPCIDLHSEGSH